VIITTLEQRGVVIDPARDILLYSSHGPTKQSYHLILPNHSHANHVHAKAFATSVRQNVAPEVRMYIDAGVYNPLQLFRLMWSTKVGKGRPKVECSDWNYRGVAICAPSPSTDPLMTFARSLVGWTANCTPLPVWASPEPSFVPKRFLTEDAEEAIALLSTDPALRTCRFQARASGAVIALRRMSPGYCPLCSRAHEHDNAYLVIRDKKVFYKCHRARAEGIKGSYALGTIS
jgi:hypothetical protein